MSLVPQRKSCIVCVADTVPPITATRARPLPQQLNLVGVSRSSPALHREDNSWRWRVATSPQLHFPCWATQGRITQEYWVRIAQDASWPRIFAIEADVSQNDSRFAFANLTFESTEAADSVLRWIDSTPPFYLPADDFQSESDQVLRVSPYGDLAITAEYDVHHTMMIKNIPYAITEREVVDFLMGQGSSPSSLVSFNLLPDDRPVAQGGNAYGHRGQGFATFKNVQHVNWFCSQPIASIWIRGRPLRFERFQLRGRNAR